MRQDDRPSMPPRVGPGTSPVGRMVGGALLGAVLGFATYWLGAALIAADELMALPRTMLPGEFQRPIQSFTYWELLLVTVAAILGSSISRYRWRIPGILSFVGLLSLTGGYLAYALWVSIPSVDPSQRWLSIILVSAETASLGLVVLSSFYCLDVAARRRWDRIPSKHAFDPSLRPKVALIVPTFNEPYEMVEQTIAHLVRQDYPKSHYKVYLADDSTDQELRVRLKACCKALGAVYVSRPDRSGFKAGAINYVNDNHLPGADLIGIIDADYWVDPDWLKSTVGHFIDPTIAFVQTPQDYRNEDESFLTRQYKRAEAYFYHAMMPSRNEVNAIIFCGTMGIIRKKALDEVGGFAPDQICEDAEVSVRLVAAGWNSMYIDQSFGHGLMPATFEAYKKQFHRWAFGNVRILFTRGFLILRSHMKFRQKADFLTSNLHWFDGLFVSVIAASLLYLGLGPIFGYDAALHHQHELALLALIPAFLLVDSMVRLRLVLATAGHGRLSEALLVQGMWFAIKFTNMVAVLKCMVGFKAPFVRTPKDSGGRRGRVRAYFRALRVTKFESFVGTTMISVAAYDAFVWWSAGELHVTQIVLPFWLAMYGLFFLCAPIYAYLSYRSLRPMHYARIPLGPGRPAATPPPRPVQATKVDFHEKRSAAKARDA